MKHFHAMAALVRLELSTRAPILAAALLVGVATIPLAAATRQQTVVFAVALAASFCLAAAGLLGANMLAEPIAQGRVGFFLGQPLAAGALWWGRLLGAAIVAIGTAVAALAPAWLWRATRLAPSEREALTLWVLALLAALPLAATGHAMATLLRVRSARAANDLAAVLVIAALAAWSVRSLKDAALDARFAWVIPLALAPVLAIGAGHAQLRRGRSDAERGHLALSTTLWVPLLLVALGLVAVTSWALDLEPSDVETPPQAATFATDGARWLVFGGVVPESPAPHSRIRQGLFSQFLVDAETGDWARLGPPVHWGRQRRFPAASPSLAADGSRIAWRSRDGAAFWAELPAHSVRNEPGAPRELRLSARALPPDFSDAYSWALSPDGRLLAAAMAGRRSVPGGNGLARFLRSVHVVELPSGDPVFSGALPWPSTDPDADGQGRDTGRDPLAVNLRWLDTTHLELAACLWPRARHRPDAVTHAVTPGHGIHVGFAELDLSDRERSAFTQVRSFAEPECGRLQLSRDGQLAAYSPEWWFLDNKGSGFRDTYGGQPIGLDTPGRRTRRIAIGDTWVAQLSELDGKSFLDHDDPRIRWFDRSGALLGEIDLGEMVQSDALAASFGGEVSGKLLVLLGVPLGRAAAGDVGRESLFLFDPSTGSLDPLSAPVMPISSQLWPVLDSPWRSPPHQPTWLPAPSSLETKLYYAQDGSLVLLDVEKGALRVLHAPPGASRSLAAP